MNRRWTVAGWLAVAGSAVALLLVVMVVVLGPWRAPSPAPDEVDRGRAETQQGRSPRLDSAPVVATRLPHPSTASAPPVARLSAVVSDEQLARYRDVSIPLVQREQWIRALGERTDDEALALLLALGDSEMYLNAAAVTALGLVDRPEAKQYLRVLVADHESLLVRRLCAAVRALGQAGGAGAVPDIAALLRANRERNDGLNELVEATCIATLQQIGDAAAVPVLAEELAHFAATKRRDLDYGLAVAQALWASAPGTPAVREALEEALVTWQELEEQHLVEVQAQLQQAGMEGERLARGEQMLRQSYEQHRTAISELLNSPQS